MTNVLERATQRRNADRRGGVCVKKKAAIGVR